jgi:hypothetical protein
VGSQAAERIRSVTSILNGETNHALDSTELNGPGFHADPEKGDRQQTHGCRGAVRGEIMRPVTWVSIEQIWSLEWSIGGTAMTTGAVPDFVADKK